MLVVRCVDNYIWGTLGRNLFSAEAVVDASVPEHPSVSASWWNQSSLFIFGFRGLTGNNQWTHWQLMIEHWLINPKHVLFVFGVRQGSVTLCYLRSVKRLQLLSSRSQCVLWRVCTIINLIYVIQTPLSVTEHYTLWARC